MSIPANDRREKRDGHTDPDWRDEWPANKGNIIGIEVIIPDIEGAQLHSDPLEAAMKDPRLSLKAKGLLAMLSWWQLSNMGLPLPPMSKLQEMSLDGSSSTRSAMKELLDHDYAYRVQVGSVVRTFLSYIRSDYARQVGR